MVAVGCLLDGYDRLYRTSDHGARTGWPQYQTRWWPLDAYLMAVIAFTERAQSVSGRSCCAFPPGRPAPPYRAAAARATGRTSPFFSLSPDVTVHRLGPSVATSTPCAWPERRRPRCAARLPGHSPPPRGVCLPPRRSARGVGEARRWLWPPPPPPRPPPGGPRS